MPERFAALLAVALLVVVVWGIWQLYKARHRVRLQSTNAGASIQEDKNGPVLLVFTAPGCSVCRRRQHPAMEEVARELGEALTVSEIDVASQPELAAQYGVVTVPSSVVFDTHGNVEAMNHGFASAEKLRLQLQQVLAPSELSENNSQALSAGNDQNEQSRKRKEPQVQEPQEWSLMLSQSRDDGRGRIG